jgi:hypothetical protein
LMYNRTSEKRWAFIAIAACFFVAVLNFERPFRGMGGYIDKGDDTYYIAYAISHLRDGNIFQCRTDVPFSHSKGVPCKGLPGTAVILELGVLVRSLVTDDSFFGDITLDKLRAMRLASAFYGFLAMIALFLVLHILGPNFINILLAGSLLWGTSLSKWTFDRSIFTHSMELFLLGSALVCLALFFKRKISATAAALGTSVILGALIFVRGEFIIAMFIVPAVFVNFQKNQRSSDIIRSLFPMLIYMGSVGLFLLAYRSMATQTSDYATANGRLILKSFSDLGDIVFWERFSKHIIMVLESFWISGGLPYVGLLTAAFFLAREKKVSKNTILASIFCVTYFVITALFNTPLGAEWQHRYFLKLYPFFFISIYLFYVSTQRWLRGILLATIFSSLVVQYKLNEAYFVNSEITYFERFKTILTDMHFDLHGYIDGFYSGYLMSYIIFAVLSFAASFKCAIELLKTRSIASLSPPQHALDSRQVVASDHHQNNA